MEDVNRVVLAPIASDEVIMENVRKWQQKQKEREDILLFYGKTIGKRGKVVNVSK